MRTLTRHSKYLGEEVVRTKNKMHSILSLNGIKIKATDIFGKKGLSELSKSIDRLSYSEKIVINDMLTRIIDINEKSEKIENEMAKIGKDRENVKKLMTIPGINIYIATGIIVSIFLCKGQGYLISKVFIISSLHTLNPRKVLPLNLLFSFI